jgi:adenine C2-methylase RlmN of 23S rRNA A2503 and tRNA A37
LTERLADSIPNLKVQISTGVDINAACGQFIVKDFNRNATAG